MMETNYQVIANEMASVCPPGYSRAWIDAEVGDSSADQGVWCETDGGRIQPEVPIRSGVNITKALVSVREQMGKGWSRCTFTLFPDGNFKFEPHYDD